MTISLIQTTESICKNRGGQLIQKNDRIAKQEIAEIHPCHSSKVISNKQTNSHFPTKEDIKKTQRLLQISGYNPGKVDGLMGKRTRNALRSFQKSHQLEIDGVLSECLFHKLYISNR